MEEQTDLFGIPIPSTNKVFLSIVILHILISLMAVLSGVFAMFAEKTSKNHKRFGNFYFWSIASSFVTIVILSLMRWPHNIHLLIIGLFNLGATLTGRQLAKAKPRNWTRLHTTSMGFSYIFLLTGFYVDNGKNLPFWRMFPELFFYVFPAVVGIPIIIKVLLSHPLNKQENH